MIRRSIIALFAAVLIAAPAVAPCAGLKPLSRRETRASRLRAAAAGLGSVMHMADYLGEYRGSRTAIFAYVSMDSEDCLSLIHNLRSQAEVQDRAGRPFWPQLCLEIRYVGLAEFVKELGRPGSRVYENVRSLARTVAEYRDQGKWFFLRPFCEMNDATQGATWEFGHRRFHNTAADLAAAWRRLRDVFDEEGASNALFIFSPLVAHGVHREAETLTALNLIPAGYIDAFGLNVYSRPMTAYGGSSADPISFESLAAPWLRLLEGSKHRGVPLAVPEMGVSNQATDSARAAWIRRAFQFARDHSFILVTYFNYRHRYWQINPGTLAGDALKSEIDQF